MWSKGWELTKKENEARKKELQEQNNNGHFSNNSNANVPLNHRTNTIILNC